mgnify:CR=1 FL=1
MIDNLLTMIDIYLFLSEYKITIYDHILKINIYQFISFLSIFKLLIAPITAQIIVKHFSLTFDYICTSTSTSWRDGQPLPCNYVDVDVETQLYFHWLSYFNCFCAGNQIRLKFILKAQGHKSSNISMTDNLWRTI